MAVCGKCGTQGAIISNFYMKKEGEKENWYCETCAIKTGLVPKRYVKKEFRKLCPQ